MCSIHRLETWLNLASREETSIARYITCSMLHSDKSCWATNMSFYLRWYLSRRLTGQLPCRRSIGKTSFAAREVISSGRKASSKTTRSWLDASYEDQRDVRTSNLESHDIHGQISLVGSPLKSFVLDQELHQATDPVRKKAFKQACRWMDSTTPKLDAKN